MFPKGLIIAFEGLDCSFKETNYKEFISRLVRDYPSKQDFIITESFPRYQNKGSYFLSKWLDGTYDREMLMSKPLAINSMYSLDRLDFWQTRIPLHNKRGVAKKPIDLRKEQTHCFIFDRYSFSNAIYNPAYGYLGSMPSIDDFNRDMNVYGNPNPDIVVWMRMKDFSVLKSLIEQKSNTDESEKNTDFIYNVWNRSEHVLKYNYFRHRIEINSSLIVIDCLDEQNNIKSREDIANEVYIRVMREAEKILERKKKDEQSAGR